MVADLRQFEFRAMAVLLRIGEAEATSIKEARLAATAVLKSCERIAARDFPPSPSNTPSPPSPPRRHTPSPTDSPHREPGRRESQGVPQNATTSERSQLSAADPTGRPATPSPNLAPSARQAVAASPASTATPSASRGTSIAVAGASQPRSPVAPLTASHSPLTTSPSSSSPSFVPSSLRANSSTPPTSPHPNLPNAPIAGNLPRQPITYPSAARTDGHHPRPPPPS